MNISETSRTCARIPRTSRSWPARSPQPWPAQYQAIRSARVRKVVGSSAPRPWLRSGCSNSAGVIARWRRRRGEGEGLYPPASKTLPAVSVRGRVPGRRWAGLAAEQLRLPSVSASNRAILRGPRRSLACLVSADLAHAVCRRRAEDLHFWHFWSVCLNLESASY
jgi:hypothetical protein